MKSYKDMERKALDLMARGISAPVRVHYQNKADVADEYRKAVKFARETKMHQAEPFDKKGKANKFGQKVMMARFHAEDAKRYSRGKRPLGPKPKKGMY